MEKQKQDDSKPVVGKPGSAKNKIIINPPEKRDPSRPSVNEAFKQALLKHVIVLEKKIELALQAKAARADFDLSVVEQVFVRGFKQQDDKLTCEQVGMNRVNSFLAGGQAMVEDCDLLPIMERMGMKGTGGAMRPHIVREKSPYNNKTVFHVVDAKGHIKHSTGDEFEAKRHLATKYSSYMEGVDSPMKRFEGTKSLVRTYKKDTPGQVAEAKKLKGKDPCWTGYKMVGLKPNGDPNCVGPVKEDIQVVAEGEMIVTPRKKYFGEPPKGTYAWERKYGKYTAKGTLRKKPNPNVPPADIKEATSAAVRLQKALERARNEHDRSTRLGNELMDKIRKEREQKGKESK